MVPPGFYIYPRRARGMTSFPLVVAAGVLLATVAVLPLVDCCAFLLINLLAAPYSSNISTSTTIVLEDGDTGIYYDDGI